MTKRFSKEMPARITIMYAEHKRKMQSNNILLKQKADAKRRLFVIFRYSILT